MTNKEIQDMPKALRLLAEEIKAPDHIPAMCLRDAAAMIETLAMDKARLDWMEKKRNVIDKGSGDYRFVANPGETRRFIDAAILQDNTLIDNTCEDKNP